MSVVNVMTNNYQQRGDDLQTKYKELEEKYNDLMKSFQMLQMDYEENEEMIRNMGEKMKKLEGEVRGLKVKLAKAKKGNSEE